MKSDGGLRAEFRARLRSLGHWVSIETGASEQGVPDLNCCVSGGREFWIECKLTTGWTCPLRPAQVGWIMTRIRKGGRVFVATRRKSKSGADELWLHDGSAAPDLKQNGLRSGSPLEMWEGGPGRWDWAAVAFYLIPSALPPEQAALRVSTRQVSCTT